MSDDDVFHMNINTLEKGLVSREYPVFEASKGNNLEFLVQHINSSEEFKAFCAEQKKGGKTVLQYALSIYRACSSIKGTGPNFPMPQKTRHPYHPSSA